jgi:two-component system sensor histidine kinase KdpD
VEVYSRLVHSRSSRLLSEPPSLVVGVAVAAAAVAAITAVIFPLREISPAASNGVAYLVAVLLVATIWGFRLGLLTSIASAAAFNFFHLPPTGRFTIAEGRHWVALGVFLVAAVVASAVAELARARAREAQERRREADLAAELARTLLGGASVDGALGEAARRLAGALRLPSAAIVLGDASRPDGSLAFQLCQDGEPIGVLLFDAPLPERHRDRLVRRVVPSLEALLAAALERERLQAQVVETRALRRSDEIKTALLQAVSHDLRTPLTAILTAGAVLVESDLSREDRTDVGRAIVEDAERLNSLVEKLLDLSRLQAGAAQPRREWCSVDEILRESASDLDPEGTRFVFSIDADVPLIRADAAQLERAFANLLENAARYSGAERVSVRARAVGEQLLIRIVDRGPGIRQEELARVFEAFYRTPDQRSRHAGSGLGLTIVKGFVEANGGRVWAESLPGQGTTFVVEFPVERDAPTPSASEEARVP